MSGHAGEDFRQTESRGPLDGNHGPDQRRRDAAEEIAALKAWRTSLAFLNGSRRSSRKREAAAEATAGEKVSFHRLTREEYRNTIRELLARDSTTPPIRRACPKTPTGRASSRIGSVLYPFRRAHVEKYLAAAETVLNEALALGPQPKREVVRWTAAKVRVNSDLLQELTKKGLADKVRADIVPNNGLDGTPGNSTELKVPVTGDYLVRVKLSGLRPEGGRAPRLLIVAVTFDRVLFEQDVEAPEDRPVTLQFRTHLPAGVHQIRIINAVPGPNPEGRYSRPLGSKPFFTMKERQPWQLKLTDDDYKPLRPVLLFDWMEWEGPMQDSRPTQAYQRIFFGGDTATKDLAYAREIIARFAARAYRRPVQPGEVDRLVKLFENSQKLGDNFEASVKTALLAVLCSKSFLFLVEGSAAAPSPRLNDWEPAPRAPLLFSLEYDAG